MSASNAAAGGGAAAPADAHAPVAVAHPEIPIIMTAAVRDHIHAWRAAFARRWFMQDPSFTSLREIGTSAWQRFWGDLYRDGVRGSGIPNPLATSWFTRLEVDATTADLAAFRQFFHEPCAGDEDAHYGKAFHLFLCYDLVRSTYDRFKAGMEHSWDIPAWFRKEGWGLPDEWVAPPPPEPEPDNAPLAPAFNTGDLLTRLCAAEDAVEALPPTASAAVAAAAIETRTQLRAEMAAVRAAELRERDRCIAAAAAAADPELRPPAADAVAVARTAMEAAGIPPDAIEAALAAIPQPPVAAAAPAADPQPDPRRLALADFNAAAAAVEAIADRDARAAEMCRALSQWRDNSRTKLLAAHPALRTALDAFRRRCVGDIYFTHCYLSVSEEVEYVLWAAEREPTYVAA